MKPLLFKTNLATFYCLVLLTTYGFSQQGDVSINQDHKISQLLDLKKEMNKEEMNYKIQIYNGDRPGAENARKEFRGNFSDWASSIEYESPNFKIWVGNFRTKLEADRALKTIQTKFPSAFRFKPKKKEKK